MTLPHQIATDGVALRRFQAADAPEIWRAIEESRALLAPWLPDIAGTPSADAVAAWIAWGARAWDEGQAYHWAILSPGDEPVLGGCGLTQLSATHRFANLYYWVRTSAQGRGLASAATRELARFGLGELGLQRVEVVVARENIASLRVAEKAGARFEGWLRNRIFLRGQAHTAAMFSLVADDFVNPAG